MHHYTCRNVKLKITDVDQIWKQCVEVKYTGIDQAIQEQNKNTAQTEKHDATG
jgi:hypothetical protein